MNKKPGSTKQRISVSILLTIFFAVQLFGVFGFPKQAKATGWPVFDASNFLELIKDNIGEVLYSSALSALVNGASYFMRKVAYDTAKYIATGGKGQGALIFKETPADYFKNVSLDAAAGAIGQLGEPFGLDLCKIPDTSLQVDLQLGLRSLYTPSPIGQGPEPRCNWQQMKEGWGKAETWTELGEALLPTFNATLSVRDSDFGIALGAIAQIDRAALKATQSAQAEREEGKGFKAVKSLISGNIKTPATVVAEETKSLSSANQTQLSMQQISGIYSSGAKAILPFAASVFLNTLVSEGLNTLFTKGLIPDDTGGKAGSGVVNFYAQNLLNNKQAVEKAFSFLFTAVPKKQLGAYDALAELEACPDLPTLNNCIIDTKFREAIGRSKVDRPLTIREAIQEGLLDGNKPLISPLRIADNTSSNCRLTGYCYSNLQKLRKLRVVPIGFELAALKSDPDQPWTLKQVVDGFDACDPTKKPGQYTDSQKFPFCHLIDPNWILRIPETRCESKVNGPLLLSIDAAERQEECVDISTCIIEGPNGECLDDQSYGYCTKEKDVWRLGTNECLPQYNTCKTFTDEKGAARSYISRTVDYGTCNAQSVGCRVYSIEKDATGWVSSAEVKPADKLIGENQVMHFNKNIANLSCPEGAEGCSAFYQLTKQADNSYKKGSPAYLKKAPDYLGCYDTNLGTPGIQYPVTLGDLGKITQNPAVCEPFASVCVAEEVSCQSYTPKTGGPAVPGVIGANGCAAECVGYDTFKQEPTQFEVAKYPLHFLPSKGETCSLQDVGCTEFTNLTNEQLTYFSSVKYCEKPNGTNLKTFYSWEGNQESGYVLKVHKLRPIDAKDADYIAKLNLAQGATSFGKDTPAYADDSKLALEENYKSCNADLYNAYINKPAGNQAEKAFNADCRAFYDEAGVVSYRILASTITVSDQCNALRKTEPVFFADASITDPNICAQKGGKFESSQCQRCSGGGMYKDGSCIYNAMAGESVSCSAEANGCRAYTGNNGNSAVEAFSSNFEGINGTALEGWSAAGGQITVAVESIQVGKHSMQVNANQITRVIPGQKLPGGNWYELSFWSRGAPQSLTVSFTGNPAVEFTKNIQTGASAPVSIGNTWRLYTLGPVFLPANDSTVALSITRSGSGMYYLDTVALKQITVDNVRLIKDSWKTTVNYNNTVVAADAPIACDPIPTDVFAGPVLGCSAYSDSNNAPAYATGFEKLCREKAVGCQPLVDTFNTVAGADAEKIQVFNAKCILPQAAVATKDTTCKVTVGDIKLGECAVLTGESSCFVKKMTVDSMTMIEVSDADIVPSTVIIPADTSLATPIFLANQPKVRCTDQQLGCTKVGVEEKVTPSSGAQSYAFKSEIFVLNNPDKYGGTNGVLCDGSQIGCAEFSSDNNKTYFKDPVVTGNTMCTYRESVSKDGNTFKGWFKVGVGQCSSDTTKLCRPGHEKDDCGSATAQCNGVGEVQCYDNFLDPGGEFGIWSNKSTNYTGYVGMCPQESNQCTELVDPEDTSKENPKGKPYYVIFDQGIVDRQKQCDAGVSLEEGCVLFDQTEKPKKDFNTVLTYDKSSEANGKQVKAENGTVQYPGNANIVLKVDRDRMCSEWLSCKSSVTQVDESGIPQKLCIDLRACDKYENGQCVSWVDTVAGQTRLTSEAYINRDTSWRGIEYTGYSLLNKFPVTDYQFITLSDPKTGISAKQYIAYQMSSENFVGEYAASGCVIGGKPVENWTSCGFGDKGGRCLEGSCYYPIDNSFKTQSTSSVLTFFNELGADRDQCKSMPEKDSPYPTWIATPKEKSGIGAAAMTYKRNDFITKKSGYANANVCQNGDCSCNYKKVEYKDSALVDYWDPNIKGLKIPEAVCAGGAYDGQACDPNEDTLPDLEGPVGKQIKTPKCSNGGGICERKSKEQTYIGFRGFCLEEDLSRPINAGGDKGKNGFACLTWLPIDTSISNVDNYNFNETAGYTPSVDAVNAEGQKLGGELFCRRSTALGAQQYDTSILPALSEVNTYFQLGGQSASDLGDPYCGAAYKNQAPNSEGTVLCGKQLQYDCDASRTVKNISNAVVDIEAHYPLEAYGLAACTQKDKLYESILHWGWSNKGVKAKNIVVLRNEVSDENYIAAEGKATLYPSKLLPVDIWYNSAEKNFLTDASGCAETDVMDFNDSANDTDYMEGGTEGKMIVRHPPRLWSKEGSVTDPQKKLYFTSGQHAKVYNDDEYFYEAGDSKNDDECFTVDYPASVSGVAAYPGPKFYDRDETKTKVYRSPFEASLTLADLKRVYFVPTLFPSGAEGNNPSLLSNQLALDIPLLSQALKDKQEGKGDKLSYTINNVASTLYDSFDDREKRKDVDLLYANNYTETKAFGYVVTEKERPDLNKDHYVTYGGSTANDPDFVAAANSALNINDRNHIAKRFVLVYFDPSKGNFEMDWIKKLGKHDLPSVDPFTNDVKCDKRYSFPDSDWSTENDNWGGNNWFAIGMDFNSKGEFLGYVSRLCNQSNYNEAEGNGINISVVAELYDQCTDFVQVQDNTKDDITDVKNKAWTDRVWKGAPNKQFGVNREKNIPQVPFGSMNLASEVINLISTHQTFRFSNLNVDGYPFGCSDILMKGFVFNSLNGGFSCDGLKNLPGFKDGIAKGGFKPEEIAKTANDLLTSLFARTYKVAQRDMQWAGDYSKWDAPSYLKDNTGKDTGPTDYSDQVGTNLKPPQIYSLNPSRCSNKTQSCSAGEVDNMTINGKNGTKSDYNNDGISDEDPTNSGVHESIISKGSFTAIAKFFASADDNRMPIRRVMMNWGDGVIVNSNKYGKYKNHKPFCELTDETSMSSIGKCMTKTTPAVSTLMTCQEDSDCGPGGLYTCEKSANKNTSFGNVPRACEEGYFEYTHSYTCPLSKQVKIGDVEEQKKRGTVLSTATIQRLGKLGLTADHSVCIYKPAVQVLDNWGWCNGSCEGGKGCYKPSSNGKDECSTFDLIKPWTFYKGNIVVIPSKK